MERLKSTNLLGRSRIYTANSFIFQKLKAGGRTNIERLGSQIRTDYNYRDVNRDPDPDPDTLDGS